MAKYIDMQYDAPAVVTVHFTVRADKWNALDDGAKREYVRKELSYANSKLADGEGTSTYITNTTVDLHGVAMDDEYEFEGKVETLGEWE